LSAVVGVDEETTVLASMASKALYQPSLIRTREPNRAFRWT
jgi:hypothetical protein